MNRRVAFVMVNHNGGDETIASAKSVLADMTANDKLFLVDNGLCLRGPCAGQSLTALAVRIEEGQVLVDVAPLRAV